MNGVGSRPYHEIKLQKSKSENRLEIWRFGVRHKKTNLYRNSVLSFCSWWPRPRQVNNLTAVTSYLLDFSPSRKLHSYRFLCPSMSLTKQTVLLQKSSNVLNEYSCLSTKLLSMFWTHNMEKIEIINDIFILCK